MSAQQQTSRQQRRAGRVPPAFAVRTATALRQFLLRLADRMLPANIAVAEAAHQFAKAHILATLSELGVADALGDEALSSAELAQRTGCDPDAMHRLLRASATFGIVHMDRHGVVRASRLTRLLRGSDPYAVGPWCRYLSSAPHQQAWSDLAASVRTGDNAFHRVNGASMFSWFAAHPEQGEHFNRGLAGLTLSDAPFVIAALPLPNSGVVCDVAGGRGALLAEILDARPGLRGVLVESAQVLTDADGYLTERGLRDRVELVTGDMFEPLDVKADLFLLKWILHDWDDPTCKRLLTSIATGMPTGATLAIIEGVQDRHVVDPRFSNVDLEMLVVTEGGRERSVEEMNALLTTAQLTPQDVTRTATGVAVLTATAN
jgi:hypothetical protein